MSRHAVLTQVSEALESDVKSLPYRYAPRPGGGPVVERKEFLRKLTEASLLKQLSVIKGPAGSGKTALLRQWRHVCQDMGRPVGWLTIDKGDDDLSQFISGLWTAIELGGYPDVARAFREAQETAPLRSPVLAAQQLAALCNASGARPLVVLDQYEEIQSPAVGEFISALLNHACDARFIIASRRRLEFSMGSLRARDQLFEIGPSDLNLTPAETHAMFPGLPELYTRRLHYDTSGEPIALGFARRVMDIPTREIVGAESWHDLLNEYYRAEVLDGLPAEIREAMSRLVIVERFDLSLARAIVGRNATNLLEQLHFVDGLILRHRGTQEFYFSEMLRRFLETRLAWLPDDEHCELHRRAAAWFALRNRNTEALRHAIAAGDSENAAELLDKVGYAHLAAHHGVTKAHEMLEAVGITPGEAPAGQLLSLAVIYANQGKFDKAHQSLEAAKRASVQDSGGSATGNQISLVEAILASFGDYLQQANTAPALLRFLEMAPATDHENRGLAQIFLSWDCMSRGQIEEARIRIDAAELEYAESDAVYASVFVHIHRVLTLFWLNELEEALQEANLAGKMTRIFFPNDQRLRAMSAVLKAGLLFELGREDPLTDMTELVGIVGALESSAELQLWAHTQGVRSAIARGAPSEAKGIIAYATEVAKRLGSQRMEWSLDLLSIEVSFRLGDLDRARMAADQLGIFDAHGLRDIAFLTWQEHAGAAMIAATLAQAAGDVETAEMMIGVAEALVKATTAVRPRIQLELLKARLLQGGGDHGGSSQRMAAAHALSNGLMPDALFLDSGDNGRHGQPGLSEVKPKALATFHCDPDRGRVAEDPLTLRERQIMLLLREGYQNKIMAHRLGLREATVKFHLRNIYHKLNAQNRTQALARYLNLKDNR